MSYKDGILKLLSEFNWQGHERFLKAIYISLSHYIREKTQGNESDSEGEVCHE